MLLMYEITEVECRENRHQGMHCFICCYRGCSQVEFRRLTEQVRDVSNDLKNKLRKSPVEVSRCFLSGSSNFLKFAFSDTCCKI